MQKFILIFLLTIISAVTIQGQETPFKPGEVLLYRAHYGFITAGNVKLTLKNGRYNGLSTYYVKTEGYTTGWIDALYSVYEVYDSFFDRKTYLPYKASEDVKEGKYRRKNAYYFNHKKNTVYSKKKGTQKVKPQTYDVISAYYKLRTIDLTSLKKGGVVTIHTYFQDEPWDLVVKFLGKETIDLEIGKIRCLKFVPLVKVEGVFKAEDALKLWISDDKNKIPVRAQFDLMVGSFKLDLVKYSGLKYPLKIKK